MSDVAEREHEDEDEDEDEDKHQLWFPSSADCQYPRSTIRTYVRTVLGSEQETVCTREPLRSRSVPDRFSYRRFSRRLSVSPTETACRRAEGEARGPMASEELDREISCRHERTACLPHRRSSRAKTHIRVRLVGPEQARYSTSVRDVLRGPHTHTRNHQRGRRWHPASESSPARSQRRCTTYCTYVIRTVQYCGRRGAFLHTVRTYDVRKYVLQSRPIALLSLRRKSRGHPRSTTKP